MTTIMRWIRSRMPVSRAEVAELRARADRMETYFAILGAEESRERLRVVR